MTPLSWITSGISTNESHQNPWVSFREVQICIQSLCALETSHTLFQDALSLLLLMIFAEIPFHHWNLVEEHYSLYLDSISTWKQYLQSFITTDHLETSCGVVSSLLEGREDSAEEGCGVCASISYKSSEDLCRENRVCHRYHLPTKVLVSVPFSSVSGDLEEWTAPLHVTGPSQILVCWAPVCFNRNIP